MASFGHINGVHMQNLDTWEAYGAAIDRGEMPLGRAYRPTDDERLIREVILQLKRGSIRPGYFAAKFGVDIRERFADVWQSLTDDGYLERRAGASVVAGGRRRPDRAPPRRPAARRLAAQRFFLPHHRGVRYT